MEVDVEVDVNSLVWSLAWEQYLTDDGVKDSVLKNRVDDSMSTNTQLKSEIVGRIYISKESGLFYYVGRFRIYIYLFS